MLTLLKDGDRVNAGQADPLSGLFEEPPAVKNPPQATVARRAKSYSDFYHVVRSHLTKEAKKIKEYERASVVPVGAIKTGIDFEVMYGAYEDDLLDASQEEYK